LVSGGLSLPLPRRSADGKAISQFQYLGPQDELTAASIVAANHAGVKTLFAIGWRYVYQSPAAAFLCSVADATDLERYCDGWKTHVNNRWGMNIELTIEY
jgi:hypothetical protein